jgi:hypothetical protein
MSNITTALREERKGYEKLVVRRETRGEPFR